MPSEETNDVAAKPQRADDPGIAYPLGHLSNILETFRSFDKIALKSQVFFQNPKTPRNYLLDSIPTGNKVPDTISPRNMHNILNLTVPFRKI